MKAGVHMKTSLRSWYSVCLAAVVWAAFDAHAARLTAVMVFSCDEDGNPAGNFVWDTRGSDSDFYKVWLTRGAPPDSLAASIINGPAWSQAPIDIELAEGTHQLTMFFQHNGPWRAFAANLFFDGSRVPAISVKAPLRTDRDVPPFSANHARNTYSLTSYPAPNTPAAGSLSTVLDRRVELTDYYVADAPLFSLDRVSSHAVRTNGVLDYVGTITLVAGPPRRPPPTRDIRIDIHITEVTVCWESEAGLMYQVQYRSRSSQEWTNLGEPVPGNGERKCVIDRIPVGEGHRFYRVNDVP
jgi:hypothetical protein